jgi:DsrE/DsrF-like family
MCREFDLYFTRDRSRYLGLQRKHVIQTSLVAMRPHVAFVAYCFHASPRCRCSRVCRPPLVEVLDKVVSKKIQICACGTCSQARGVTDGDLAPWNAKFGNPAIFVSLVEWADRVITE